MYKTPETFPQRYRPLTMAPHGMVASPHYLASQAGVDVLKKGGTAVDAAIATNSVLNVVYPHMCGIGGDALAHLRRRQKGPGLPERQRPFSPCGYDRWIQKGGDEFHAGPGSIDRDRPGGRGRVV